MSLSLSLSKPSEKLRRLSPAAMDGRCRRYTPPFSIPSLFLLLLLLLITANHTHGIRVADQISDLRERQLTTTTNNQPLKSAVFALGSFWRSEAAFGCFPGVVRTTVGYSGGTRLNPEYRRLGDHAESVQVYSTWEPFNFKIKMMNCGFGSFERLGWSLDVMIDDYCDLRRSWPIEKTRHLDVIG